MSGRLEEYERPEIYTSENLDLLLREYVENLDLVWEKALSYDELMHYLMSIYRMRVLPVSGVEWRVICYPDGWVNKSLSLYRWESSKMLVTVLRCAIDCASNNVVKSDYSEFGYDDAT